MEGSFVFKARVLNYSLLLPALCAHSHRFRNPSALLQHFSRRDGAEQQREEPVFAANIPLKVALFAASTGHEYQAEGAEGAVDSPPTRCRCRLAEARSAAPASLKRSLCVNVLPAPVAIASYNLGFLVSSYQQRTYIVVFIPFLNASNGFFCYFFFFFLSYTCLKHLNECAFV